MGPAVEAEASEETEAAAVEAEVDSEVAVAWTKDHPTKWLW